MRAGPADAWAQTESAVSPDPAVAAALRRLAARIGPGMRDLDFRVRFAGGARLGLAQCRVKAVDEADGGLTVRGLAGRLRFRWSFVPWAGGFWVALAVERDGGPACTRPDVLRFAVDAGPAVADWRVPTLGLHVEDAGLIRVADLTKRSERGTLLRGAFPAAGRLGPFVGSRIPQRCVQVHRVRRAGPGSLAFASSTRLTAGLGMAERIAAEGVWVCATKPLAAAIAAYVGHLPEQSAAAAPPVGWNSWDYYYSSVSAADAVENMDAIRDDPALARAIRHVVVDTGWNHNFGEWQPNHRFPDGLAPLAGEIAGRGFVPGIWTAPVRVDPLSAPGLRRPDLLVRDAHGDPLRTGGTFVLDPTHPSGEAFVRELYTRLHAAGFRFFKVDFVDGLLEATRFHDPAAGQFDALRRLFALIRECVGAESHVLGCSLPPECGPGVVDSGRIGVDIHNQWSHVEWAFDFFQLTYWLHRRVWTNDVDFLVVRGAETSRDGGATVLNPHAHAPDPPKWRRGPVFQTVEGARTWATIVALSGGSLFLGDRIRTLNPAGKGLIEPLLPPTGIAAEPLDLGDGARASLWRQRLPGEERLAVVNWSDAPATRTVAFAALGVAPPESVRSFWTGAPVPVVAGACHVTLPPRGSEILVWSPEESNPERTTAG